MDGLSPMDIRTGRAGLTVLPHGVRLECLVTGAGAPTTVFAHGLAAGIPDTRPFGSGVAGRKVFFQFRGHGRSEAPPGRWTYADLASDLRAVADTHGATRALGVSLGAGALTRLVADTPDRFERLVLVLPAVLDQPRLPAATGRLVDLLAGVEAGNLDAVAGVFARDLPPDIRATPEAVKVLRGWAVTLLAPGMAGHLRGLLTATAVPDRSALSAVTAEALVVGARGDDAHPGAVAEALVAALPNATLHLYDGPGIRWNARDDLRGRISTFLNR